MQLPPRLFTTAMALAGQRGWLPTALGSGELAQTFTRAIRERTLILARVTSAAFVSEVRRELAGYLQGGTNQSRAEIIGRLRELLARLGYSPETGFPGDAARGIPPAEPGSLQDLSSFARLDLILDTEMRLANGLQSKLAGETPVALALYPAYELVRLENRRVPRGSVDSGSLGWGERWVKAKLPEPVLDGHTTRMIAAKGHPGWARLGSRALFGDALDVDFPPFAFRSGYGWKPVSAATCQHLGVDVSPSREITPQASAPRIAEQLASPPVNVRRIEPKTKAETLAALARLKASFAARAAA